MKARSVWLIAGLTVAAGCGDTLGPVLMGRWAAPGIELTASAGIVDLRLPCVRPFRAPPLIMLAGERIQFSGRVDEMFYRYDFTFRGQFVGDTLFATVSRTGQGFDPLVSNYVMTRGGDSGLDHQICLA